MATPDLDPAEPLENARHERFAKLFVRHPHLELRELWRMSSDGPIPDGVSQRGLTASGSRTKRLPNVAARIRHLTAEARKIAAEGQEGDLATLTLEETMARVSDVLRRCYDRLKDEGAPENDLSRLRRTMAEHVGRFAMKLATLRKVDGPQDVVKVESTPVLFRNLKNCECQNVG